MIIFRILIRLVLNKGFWLALTDIKWAYMHILPIHLAVYALPPNYFYLKRVTLSKLLKLPYLMADAGYQCLITGG